MTVDQTHLLCPWSQVLLLQKVWFVQMLGLCSRAPHRVLWPAPVRGWHQTLSPTHSPPHSTPASQSDKSETKSTCEAPRTKYLPFVFTESSQWQFSNDSSVLLIQSNCLLQCLTAVLSSSSASTITRKHVKINSLHQPHIIAYHESTFLSNMTHSATRKLYLSRFYWALLTLELDQKLTIECRKYLVKRNFLQCIRCCDQCRNNQPCCASQDYHQQSRNCLSESQKDFQSSGSWFLGQV